jgi:hypothetical protein
MIDVPKELCEVYERKEIGQPVTLTGFYYLENSKKNFLFYNHFYRSIFTIRSKSFFMSLCN